MKPNVDKDIMLIFYKLDLRLADSYIRFKQTFDQKSFDPTTYTLCHYQLSALETGKTRIFQCNQPTEGRFVTIHFPTTKTEYLTLYEVAVYKYKGRLSVADPGFSIVGRRPAGGWAHFGRNVGK